MMKKLLLILTAALLVAMPASAKEKDSAKTGKQSKVSLWKYFDGSQKTYVYSYFRGEGTSYVYSYDGVRWLPLTDGEGNEIAGLDEGIIRKAAKHSLKNAPEELSSSWNESCESQPQVMKIDSYTYLFWYKEKLDRMGMMRTKKPKKGPWEDVSDLVRFPSSHPGTLYEVDTKELRKLLK